MGLKKTLNKITDASSKKIIIATVGMGDPRDKENTDKIRDGIKSKLSDEVYRMQASIF